jgi:hypothetical protein
MAINVCRTRIRSKSLKHTFFANKTIFATVVRTFFNKLTQGSGNVLPAHCGCANRWRARAFTIVIQ